MIGLSVHSFILFSVVSMEILKPVSQENDYFNLRLNTSTSICQTFSNYISLKLSSDVFLLPFIDLNLNFSGGSAELPA